jgi:hypothetical protein
LESNFCLEKGSPYFLHFSKLYSIFHVQYK